MMLPRLANTDADDAFDALSEEWRKSKTVRVSENLIVAAAEFPPVGGTPVTSARLASIRRSVLQATADLPVDSASEKGHFDRQLSVALGSNFGDLPLSQSGDPRAWQYLALTVFPDLIVHRFPPTPEGVLEKRRFGADRRNALLTAFRRWQILGPMLGDSAVQLTEDDLVQIVDRSLSNDHRLARAIARKIGFIRRGQEGRGTARRNDAPSVREKVREGLKAVQFERRVTALETLTDVELENVLAACFTTGNQVQGDVEPGPVPSSADPDREDFIRECGRIGVDIKPALKYEIPNDEQLSSIREALATHASRGVNLALSAAIFHRLNALLDRWLSFTPAQQQILIAVVLYFVFEEDAKNDFTDGGFDDDLAVVELAEQFILT